MPTKGKSRKDNSSNGIKARRATRACDFCHRRSIRCRPSQENPSTCQSCKYYGEPCVIKRPLKKRGVKPAIERPSSSTRTPTPPHREPTTEWIAPTIGTQALILDLAEVYFEVVNPIFPFFHQPTILRRVARGEHQTDRPFHSVTMAVCALASARARDGAVFSDRWAVEWLTTVPSERFFAAAEEALPRSRDASVAFDYLRTCTLLSIAAIQYGQPRVMRYYLSQYHSLVELDGLHDEANWRKGIGIVELEERRRLFWSIYTLDVYTSIVWGGCVRPREAQSNVFYPTALDDEHISNDGYTQLDAATRRSSCSAMDSPINGDSHSSWLYGWNLTTDLYRILEHALDQFRRRRPQHRLSTHIDSIFQHSSVPSTSVLDAVLTMYQGLPARSKETPPASSPADHRLNFQTANIAATVQLVRMMLFATEDATVAQRCRVASELLQAFSDVPVIYLRAISSPLLHHLAGIGSLLGSVFEHGLPESAYQQIRTVLVSMVQLLADLEVGLYCTAGTSSRIQTLVERIDQYIASQRQLTAASVHQRTNSQPTANMSPSFVDPASPLFQLPPELLEDWSWAFDFAQVGS